MMAIFTVIFIFAGVCSASDDTFSRGTLKGVKGIYVLIEDLPKDIEEKGLTLGQIQTDVELKLRMAGIKILSREESLASKDQPYLYVKLYTKKSVSSFCLNISIEFSQKVILQRTSESADATTWSTESVGSFGEENIMQIRDAIKDGVDIFINAYLSINPKK